MITERPGATKILILLRLHHVERFLVGEARVVDHLDAVAHALLDRLARARVRGQALAAHLHLARGHRHFLVAHPAGMRIRAGHQVVAGEVELHLVDAVLEEHAHGLAHPLGAIHHAAERHLRERQVRQHVVTERAGDRDLLTRREVARAGDLPRVDGVANHAVEPRLGSRRAHAGRPAVVQVELGHLRRPQGVLLVRHLLDGVQRLGVGPAEVRVRLAHAGHQGRAGPVDHRHPGGGEAARAPADARDPVALYQQLPRVGLRAGGVDYAYVREEDVRHVGLLSGRNRFDRPTLLQGVSRVDRVASSRTPPFVTRSGRGASRRRTRRAA